MSNKKFSRKDFFSQLSFSINSFANEAFKEELDKIANLFPDIIRPPGASEESKFQTLCTRCGACIRACKYLALQKTLSHNVFNIDTPSLNVGSSYCRFCEDAPCINACETGALSFENYKKSIGLAVIYGSKCIRKDGVDCKNCMSKCDSVENAIKITDSEKCSTIPIVNNEACSGCGACATVCPADAITITS